MFTNRSGLISLLKEGSLSFKGLDEATRQNIEACKDLSSLTQTSFGLQSMNKLIVNHLEKKFITSDTPTILKELDVQHPAAKLLVMASEMQSQEFGDGTNYVLIISGELLNQAEFLLKQGLHISDIVRGFELALEKALQYLKEDVCWKLDDIRSITQLTRAITTSLSTKPIASEAKLENLVAQACIQAMPLSPQDFNIENIRVSKILGGPLSSSHLMNGMIINTEPKGCVKKKENPKVMVTNCGFEMTGTETKGTVLLHNAEELVNFSKGEEKQMEELVKGIKNAGVDVVIVHGGSLSDIAMHYCNKYELLVFKVSSKFDTQRLCRSLGATALVRLGVPTQEELGVANSIYVEEISSKKVTVIKAKDTRISTIVLRGATRNIQDEAERAIDNGINLVKSLTKDTQFVPGGGAIEIQISHRIQAFGSTISGLEQYSILKFAEALEIVPKLLAESFGYNSDEILTLLHKYNREGKKNYGVNADGINKIHDVNEAGVLDHYMTKSWGLRLAVEAVLTILKIDQIIMSRPSGGPKFKKPGPPDL